MADVTEGDPTRVDSTEAIRRAAERAAADRGDDGGKDRAEGDGSGSGGGGGGEGGGGDGGGGDGGGGEGGGGDSGGGEGGGGDGRKGEPAGGSKRGGDVAGAERDPGSGGDRSGSGPGEDAVAQAALLVRELIGGQGVSDHRIADLIVGQLSRVGVDVPRVMREIQEARERDRVAVAAEEIGGQLTDVVKQIQVLAGSAAAAVDVRQKDLESRAYMVIQASLLAQAVLETLERKAARVVTRAEDALSKVDQLSNGLGQAQAEVLAAEKAAERWEDRAAKVGRGVWWWALVGGFVGAVVGVSLGVFVAG